MKEYTLDYEGGNYLSEVFYEIRVYQDDLMQKYDPKKNIKHTPWIVKRRFPERPGFERNLEPWIEMYDAEKFVHGDCPLDPQHYTRTHYKNLRNGEIHYNFHYGDFIACEDWNQIFVSNEFKEKLEKQKFNGIMLDPLECAIVTNKLDWTDRQTIKDTRTIYRLQGAGKVYQKPVIFKDGKNECPYCHKGPLYCPTCGAVSGNVENENDYLPEKCGYCNKVIGYDPTDPDKKPAIKCTNYNRDVAWLLDGKTWDGQDFYQIKYILFVSRRVLDFLLEQKAAPFAAIPCRFFTDDMTEKQMEQLKVVTNGRLK